MQTMFCETNSIGILSISMGALVLVSFAVMHVRESANYDKTNCTKEDVKM